MKGIEQGEGGFVPKPNGGWVYSEVAEAGDGAKAGERQGYEMGYFLNFFLLL